MEAIIDWLPRTWSDRVDVTFTFFWDTTATEPWLVYREDFLNTDSAVDNDRLMSRVNEIRNQIGDLVGRYSAIVAALGSLPTGWTAIGAIYGKATWQPVPGVAGVAVTLAYARNADGSGAWFSETKAFSVTDQRVTAQVVTDAMTKRARVVAGMAVRGHALETALGITVGVRFPVGGAA